MDKFEVWYHTLVGFDVKTGQVKIMQSYTSMPKDKEKQTQKVMSEHKGVVEI